MDVNSRFLLQEKGINCRQTCREYGWIVQGAANSPVAWGSDYHMNVNLQMNYWPTYVTNMAECAEPLIDYVEGLREPGRITASTYFGIDNSDGKQNGFMANTQNTPFGWTCPGWAFSWGWSPAAVPWILQNVYEAYEYSGDVEKLESEIFPMMEEEAKILHVYFKRSNRCRWNKTLCNSSGIFTGTWSIYSRKRI